ASGRQISINRHIIFNLIIQLQRLNGLETLVIFLVANKYAFLHSFPTRRSSDLSLQNLGLALRREQGPRKTLQVQARHARDRPERSEEHTSELQSRSDLVCSLLLEKKKSAARDQRSL